MPDFELNDMIEGMGQFDYRELTQAQAREIDRHCDKWLASRGIKANRYFTWSEDKQPKKETK